ncbi:translocator protein, LysE family [Lentilactobacillus rapi DSM 19907 = JCM 15042]|uniref:Translocator protein, LysE family n=2 Tax=Lentilactobacillus rapi TaxID=481723 RepID=A0ABR5PE89_9LACO|nr:translocator protein, LysE family [Lentilactobacillus rapi DSM 19907 = JCM 15042]
MLLNLTNVKVILYFLVGYISFLMPIFKNRQLLILSFGVIMCFITTACNVLWALLGSLFQSWFTDHGKFINAVLSVLLIYAIYEMWK